MVDELGALGLGQHEPYDRECLEGKVEGEPVEDQVYERLDEDEKAVDDPVCEPARRFRVSICRACADARLLTIERHRLVSGSREPSWRSRPAGRTR